MPTLGVAGEGAIGTNEGDAVVRCLPAAAHLAPPPDLSSEIEAALDPSGRADLVAALQAATSRVLARARAGAAAEPGGDDFLRRLLEAEGIGAGA